MMRWLVWVEGLTCPSLALGAVWDWGLGFVTAPLLGDGFAGVGDREGDYGNE
jgi:hypothetical protein